MVVVLVGGISGFMVAYAVIAAVAVLLAHLLKRWLRKESGRTLVQ